MRSFLVVCRNGVGDDDPDLPGLVSRVAQAPIRTDNNFEHSLCGVVADLEDGGADVFDRIDHDV